MKPALGSGTERKGSVARYSGCRTELSWLLMVPEGGKFASLGKQVPVPCTELEHLRRAYTHKLPSAIISGAPKNGITYGLGGRQKGRAEGGHMKTDLFFVPRWNLLVSLRSAVVPSPVCYMQRDSHRSPPHLRHFLGEPLDASTH